MDLTMKILNNRRNERILLVLIKEIRLQNSEIIKIQVGRIIKNFQSEKEFSDFLLLLDSIGAAKLQHINYKSIASNNQTMSRPTFYALAQRVEIGSGLSYSADMIFKCDALKIENILKKIKDKIEVHFSKKYGIYCNPDYKNKGYQIEGGRKRLIWRLKEKDLDHIPTEVREEGITTQNLSRDIKAINIHFRNILGLDYNLIEHYSGEYYLNVDDYKIKIDED